MALVFVSKEMQVANPVGHVNLHPLPAGLPSGLVRAHLMRLGLGTVQLNLVNGNQISSLVEYITPEGTPGDLEYKDTHIHTLHGSAGWRDESYQVDYAVGYTWMAVGKDTGELDAIHAATASFGDDQGEELSWRNGGVRFVARRNGFTSGANIVLPEVPDGFYMGFGGIDRAAQGSFNYVPHADLGVADSGKDLDDPPQPSTPGLLLARTTDYFPQSNDEKDTEMAMFAAWDRPLATVEMQAVYAKLKPWLAARGVEIA